jgi:LPXTG-motif cell wall-anchored protein
MMEMSNSTTAEDLANFMNDKLRTDTIIDESHDYIQVDSKIKAVYKQVPKTEGTVSVQYVDTDGNVIGNPEQLSGLIGSKFTVTPKTIGGYNFKVADNSLSGDFTDEDQTVTLTYEQVNDTANSNNSDNHTSNGTTDQNINATKPSASQNLANGSIINLASLGNTKTNTSRSSTTWNVSSLPQGQQEDVLPSTGMKSTSWLTLLGVVMVLLSSLFVLKKTRHTK